MLFVSLKKVLLQNYLIFQMYQMIFTTPKSICIFVATVLKIPIYITLVSFTVEK
jgi:hypothetical protein